MERPWGPDAFGPAPRAELLHVLMLPDFEQADRIGESAISEPIGMSPRRWRRLGGR